MSNYYTQGICGDGFAILNKDGQPLTVDEIVGELNQMVDKIALNQAHMMAIHILVSPIIDVGNGSEMTPSQASKILSNWDRARRP